MKMWLSMLPAPHGPAVTQSLPPMAPTRAQLAQNLFLEQLPPLLDLPAVPAAPAAQTQEPFVAPAGLRRPFRQRTATRVLPNLLVHFGYLDGLDFLGEAADHQMTQMVVVGEVAAAAVEAVALEGPLSPATPTMSESL